MPRLAIASVMALTVLLATNANAQWLKSPTPGIPRTADGKPDLTAAAPKSTDGKPDLSGVWQMRLPLAYIANIVADLKPAEIMPWANKVFRDRVSDYGKDDPWTIGCLPGGPRLIVGSRPMESFFSTVKSELADRFDSFGEAKMELFDYIEVFYNQRRRHSTLGQISPAAFERRAPAA